MDKILKTEKVNSSRNCKELLSLYDQIKSHVRSLHSVGVKSEHYGPLLIPIILEKVPDEIKLEISCQLGRNNWKTEDFMNVVKNEITARESCDFVRNQKKNPERSEKDAHCSPKALLAGNIILVCVFCHQNHYSDKCTVMTDVDRRKEMVWRNRLCFKCLSTGHPIRKCRSKFNCYRCRSANHHTAICDKDLMKMRQTIKVEEESSLVVNSQTPVLRQTASGIIFDHGENKSKKI